MIKLIYPADDAKLTLVAPPQRDMTLRIKRGEFTDDILCDGNEYSICGGMFDWLYEIYMPSFGYEHTKNPNEITFSSPQFIKFSWEADVNSHVELRTITDIDYPNDPLPAEIEYIYSYEGNYTQSMYNFLMNTTYAWKVVADDGSCESEERFFTTLDEYQRLIYAQGTANVRDIGGATTIDGKRVLQGRIYRGGALESDIDVQYKVTPKGIHTLKDVLKIKTEIDLRDEAYGNRKQSELGDDVNLIVLPTYAYGSFFEEWRYPHIKRQMEIFADENNYPMHIHCVAGADRTGMVVYWLYVLLKVRTEDIMLDYSITSLSMCDIRSRPNLMRYRNSLLTQEELQTLSEEEIIELASVRVEELFIDKCGVSPEDIQKIKKIFLG